MRNVLVHVFPRSVLVHIVLRDLALTAVTRECTLWKSHMRYDSAVISRVHENMLNRAPRMIVNLSYLGEYKTGTVQQASKRRKTAEKSNVQFSIKRG